MWAIDAFRGHDQAGRNGLACARVRRKTSPVTASARKPACRDRDCLRYRARAYMNLQKVTNERDGRNNKRLPIKKYAGVIRLIFAKPYGAAIRACQSNGFEFTMSAYAEEPSKAARRKSLC
jgi:hypothetical protein